MTESSQQTPSELAYAGERYYHHTGRAPLFGTTLAAVTAWAPAAALGIAYAYTDLYVKVADLASALIVMLFAAAGGFCVFLVMRWAKVRNTAVIAIVAIFSASPVPVSCPRGQGILRAQRIHCIVALSRM